MNDDLLLYIIIAGFGLSGLAVAVGAWLPRHKRLPDWLMAAGGTLALLAFIGLLVMIFGPSFIRWIRQDLWVPAVLSGMGAGLLLFAMGYVMDRIGRRKVENFHDQVR